MIEFANKPDLFTIGNYTVHSWGFIVAVGIIIGLAFIYKEAVKRKLKEDIEWLVFWIIPLSIIGARLAYISLNLSEFPTFISLLDISSGGLVGWGAILGGIAGIIIFKMTRKINNEKLMLMLDIAAPYIALMFAIGRIGCFVRGCCFGIPTDLPWGIIHPGENIATHPTQIYHSMADFIIFLLLLRLKRKKENLEKNRTKSKYRILNMNGGLFLIFIMLYSAERFFIDFLRYHPPEEYLGMITITQAVYMLIFAIFFYISIKKQNKKEKNH